jgi:stage II sporulation protein D
MHRRFWGLLVAAAVLTPAAPARATVPVVIIDGRGWGHGVGMAQDGAFWMAKAGAGTPQILGQFYPGTSLGKVTASAVRVKVFSAIAVTVAFPSGGRIDERGDESVGFPVRVDPGGQVRLQFTDGRITVDPVVAARPTPAPTTTTAAPTTSTIGVQPRSTSLLPAPTTTSTSAPGHSAPAPASSAQLSGAPSTTRPLALTAADGGTVTVVDRQRTYRGFIDALPTDAGLRLVNQVDVEQYLRGMGEVRDPTWPAAALRTQAVAARTYALRAMAAAGELCDSTRCQVYLGQQAEYTAMDKAVAATAGQVLVFNHGLASAVYSANGGGHSASREEGFGTTGGNYPYLRPAPYETKNPMPWTLTVGLDDIAARLGQGPITNVEVAESGPSGRALTVALDGPDGRRSVSGLAFAAALGLRSTRFITRMGVADSAPPPPSGSSALQAPPDDVALSDATASVAAPAPSAVALDLPDRPQAMRPRLTHRLGRVSTPFAFGELTLAVAVFLAVSWRRPPVRRDVASLRSWRAARPPEGGQP